MSFSIEKARNLLSAAEVFCWSGDDGDEMAQTLNMNDTWVWASADGEYVPDEKLPEVALLFWRYGFPGLLYWVSNQNDGMRSEFEDINRFIAFVRNEEKLRAEVSDSSARAYKKINYTLGESG